MSEWSVKSKCQSFLSSTLRVLACKSPQGEPNLSPPLSFSHPAAIPSPKPGRKCHIEPLCLCQGGDGGMRRWGRMAQTLFTQTNSTRTQRYTPCPCRFPEISYKRQLSPTSYELSLPPSSVLLVRQVPTQLPISIPRRSSLSVQWQQALSFISTVQIIQSNKSRRPMRSEVSTVTELMLLSVSPAQSGKL